MFIATDVILKILFAPVLLGQGLHVRRKAQLLDEPPGARWASMGSGPPLRLLVVGDSSAAGVGASHQNHALFGRLSKRLAAEFQITIQLNAETGATAKSAVQSIRNLEELHPADLVIVVLGVNDVTHGTPLGQLLSDRVVLYQLLKRRVRAKQIIVTGIPPLGYFPLLPQPLRWVLGKQAARYDFALAKQAQAMADVSYFPFDLPYRPDYVASDGFHPSETAYDLWAEKLCQICRDLYPS